MKTMSFNDEEISLITYALRELANRRSEQAINYGGAAGVGAQKEAARISKLEKRFHDEREAL